MHRWLTSKKEKSPSPLICPDTNLEEQENGPFRDRHGRPSYGKILGRAEKKQASNRLSKSEQKAFKKLIKAFKLLEVNPQYPGLQSHEIDPLTRRYGSKVFQSYLENRKPAAGRLFWVYGPGKGQITIIGLEPHPEDNKRGGYDRVELSQLRPHKSSDKALKKSFFLC